MRDGAAQVAWAVLFCGLPAVVAWYDSARTDGAAPPPRHMQQQARELPPKVEPVQLKSVSRDDAIRINALSPILPTGSPARPYRFPSGAMLPDRERATACLAAAQYYEAGDDPTGQRAVAQVVLNRVRHPAFPKTICGVVFQGSERATGCQFTFTCDGSLQRYRPTPAAWIRATKLAARMMEGSVDKSVGLATHYHANWVVPYWSGSLDKIASVEPHLFFRWKGYWGTPAAFRLRPEAKEPAMAALAFLSPLHNADMRDAGAGPTGLPDAAAMARTEGRDDAPKTPDGVRLIARSGDGEAVLLSMPALLTPAQYGEIAKAYCGGRTSCRIMGWRAGEPVRAAFPPDAAALRTMQFSYIHDAGSGLQRILWNCNISAPPPGVECMRNRFPAADAKAD